MTSDEKDHRIAALEAALRPFADHYERIPAAVRETSNRLESSGIIIHGDLRQQIPLVPVAAFRVARFVLGAHWGDPCRYCGVGHDDVPVGPCSGRADARKLEELKPEHGKMLDGLTAIATADPASTSVEALQRLAAESLCSPFGAPKDAEAARAAELRKLAEEGK